MGNEAVRLRRATMHDYDFCKILYDDIAYEILCNNRKAFGLPEIKDDNEEIIEFYDPKLTRDWFEKCLTVWRHKIYIIEFVFEEGVIPIGYFDLLFLLQLTVAFIHLEQPPIHHLVLTHTESSLNNRAL